jgi:hypothetical protein
MAEMMITVPSLFSELTGMRNIYNVVWNENPIPFEGGNSEVRPGEESVVLRRNLGREYQTIKCMLFILSVRQS